MSSSVSFGVRPPGGSEVRLGAIAEQTALEFRQCSHVDLG
jgi:hypothetical protein